MNFWSQCNDFFTTFKNEFERNQSYVRFYHCEEGACFLLHYGFAAYAQCHCTAILKVWSETWHGVIGDQSDLEIVGITCEILLVITFAYELFICYSFTFWDLPGWLKDFKMEWKVRVSLQTSWLLFENWLFAS